MSKLCKGKINIEFCCNEQHKLELIRDLVMEYFVIRNHFETKTWKRNDDNCAKAKSIRNLLDI
jgi:hypothetical protein